MQRKVIWDVDVREAGTEDEFMLVILIIGLHFCWQKTEREKIESKKKTEKLGVWYFFASPFGLSIGWVIIFK